MSFKDSEHETVVLRPPDEDGVYFGEDTCLTSFSGCVDLESSMTEQDISEFIRQSNHSRYGKRNGVLVPSSHLPVDDAQGVENDPAGQIEHELRAEEEKTTRLPERYPEARANETAAVTRPTSISENVLERKTTGGQDFKTVEPFVLADRDPFNLCQHSEQDVVYCCFSPVFPNAMNVIPVGELSGTVQDPARNQGNKRLTDRQPSTYYCFERLQDVVKCEVEKKMEHGMLPRLLDGPVNKALVLDQAEKIHPPLKEKDFRTLYLPEEPTVDPGEGSNTPKAIRLRRQRQFEIEWIKEHLKLKEENKVETSKTEGTKLRVPVIRHSTRMEPYRERYKKQGLEWSATEVKRRSGSSGVTSDVTRDIPDHYPHVGETLNCYCREPDEDGKMVRCSSKSCMFGLIHHHCAGLEQIPSISEEYLCDYCKAGIPKGSEEGGEASSFKICGRRTASQESNHVNRVRADVMELDPGADMVERSTKDSEARPINISGWVAVNRVPPKVQERCS
ncbi:uncharacterized protein Z518_02045 [Rhinocladiella mackenziei CBS 650.93]|uniref:Rhinocladiella mackenziei CBS 650.93 unplaced genomic scaffold supercont1.2, whole genome shotgun sequence n=1 Tax=Rhinocladiella mackenziei CBS 650.93 TaxID=1442369 RepID=A0A0D2FYK4_9EURO|nr:uncharacterized protein Z518_02045 [Rhinocladiella mackenziei CBS 650.93]KIX07392.1 hypothetical protein Z518_02045 [Rhinocladiella mackenziei CBS 650.93]